MGTEKLFDIREELKKLPDHPGVYIMHDAPGCDHLCRKGHQPEKPGAAVFSDQPEQGTQRLSKW